MSDKSLPKPVPPLNPQNKGGSLSPQMPPSARVQAPPKPVSKKPPQLPVNQAPNKPPISKPQVSSPPQPSAQMPGKPASASQFNAPTPSKPPTAGPPPQMGMKPPNFPGKPPQVKSSAAPTTPPAAAGAVAPAPANQDEDKKKSAKFADVKNSPFKFLPYLIGGIVLISIVGFVISKVLANKSSSTTSIDPEQQPSTRKTVPAKQTSITYWGLWEPDSAVATVLEKFEEANPEVKVNYVKQSHKDYRERLQTAVASGNGPDVFRYHANWVPMLREELSSMPQSVMTASMYQQTFYPVAAKLLNVNGQIVGIPLMYEGLGLYYNKEMLTSANSQPPTTWAEVKTLANKLTVRDGNGVKRAGMAIGNASNVEHFSDILGLLMLQNGADPSDPSSKEAQDALSFYTNFIIEDKVWSDTLPSSTVAFARGDAAMMLAPSWRAHEVKTMSPDLEFGIAPLPRLGEERLAWASFWAEGVSSKSENKDESWALISFLSSKEIQQELYSSQSQIRSFGEIYSRVDLADQLAGNELVEPFLQDAPYATSWNLSSYTHDNGINDLLIKYYQDAINAVLGGTSVEQALVTVKQGTQQILRQYGVE